jgi:hypothetical protein
MEYVSKQVSAGNVIVEWTEMADAFEMFQCSSFTKLSATYTHFLNESRNLMFVPCIAGLCIKTNTVHLVSSICLLLMRLLHVSAPTCHPQGASLSS